MRHLEFPGSYDSTLGPMRPFPACEERPLEIVGWVSISREPWLATLTEMHSGHLCKQEKLGKYSGHLSCPILSRVPRIGPIKLLEHLPGGQENAGNSWLPAFYHHQTDVSCNKVASFIRIPCHTTDVV